MHFGMHVGWPLLAAAVLAIYYLRKPALDLPEARGTMARLLAFFSVALFMVWTPFDFWPFLPRVFGFVQFPYRLLMFVVFWAALLGGYAVVQLFKGQMRFEHLVLGIVLVGLYMASGLAPQRASATITVENEISHPDMNRASATNYIINPTTLVRTTFFTDNTNWAEWQNGLVDLTQRLNYPPEGAFPAPRRGDRLHLQGVVPEKYQNPVTLTISMNDQVLAAPSLPPGPFNLVIPMRTSFPGERVRLALRPDRYLQPEAEDLLRQPPTLMPSLVLHTLKLERHPAHRNKRSVGIASRAQSWSGRHAPTYTITTRAPGIVKLPVLYYPEMLHIRDNQKPVAYGNLGRFVAMELPPGRHIITVRFAGVVWANGISLVGWIGWVCGFLFLAWQRLRGRKQRVPDTDFRQPRRLAA
jgi:hypothetical protein